MIKQEFLGIDQGPDQVLVPLAERPPGTAAGQMIEADGTLLVRRSPREADAIELGNPRRVGAGVGEPAVDPAAAGFERLLDLRRAEQEEALREGGLGPPLALADALAPGTTEDLEEARRKPFVGKLRRPQRAGQAGERLRARR